MKIIGKKAFVYIIVGLLTFSSTYMSYYRSVHAMEWVGGALAFEEALKWTLAVLGITATAGMTDAYWEEYGDEFVDYAIENGATQSEVAEWQMKLCEGILDKASSVWTSFKSWAKTLISGSSSGGSTLSAVSIPELVQLYSNFTGYGVNSINYGSFDQNLSVYSFYALSTATGNAFSIECFTNNDNMILKSVNVNRPFDYYPTVEDVIIRPSFRIWVEPINHTNLANFSLIEYTNSGGARILNSWDFNYYNLIIEQNPDYPLTGVITNFAEGLPDVPVGDDFQGLQDVDVENIDVISADLPDVGDPEVTLPFPGLDTSDNSISSDTYDDIIGAINDGTIDIDDGIDDIISMLKVISYDMETDDVIPPRPNPEDPTENVKKDDVINENRNNMGFTLAGLENVFPFCIPWDIYAFMTLLVADPVAPEFDFPIKSVNNRTENIHVDLEPFEPVAVVVRYVFDFLFIIGLGMLTRSMIGGGSCD